MYLFRYLLILAMAISQVSCATRALHSGRTSQHENITSFMITPDAGTLVVAGDRHHFIFPLQEPLRSLLQWPGRKQLKPVFDTFRVTSGQSISGRYTLTANLSQLDMAEARFLTQRGFSRMADGVTLRYQASIRGTRYLAGNVKVPQTGYFRQPYQLTVTSPDGVGNTAVKLALTPLTLAADGVTAVLGGIVLAPFFGLWVLSGS